MAKIKYSALVSEMSGKLNGSVMSKNRSGNYVRTKITPVNPQTVDQVAVRNRLAGNSALWRSLTEAARLAWNSAVSDWAGTNVFGDTVKPSGQNLFVKVNNNLLNVGSARVSLPPNKVGATPVVSLTVVNDISDGKLELTFEPATVPAGHSLVVEATAGMSAGRSYMKNQFRQIAVLPPTTATGENVFAQYVAKFGQPEAGQKTGVRVKMVNNATGEVSLALSDTTIWVA